MKKDIHPQYKPVKLTIGKDSVTINSTYPSDTMLMDIDFRTHPAWTKSGVSAANASNKSVSSFNKKFAGLSFGAKK